MSKEIKHYSSWKEVPENLVSKSKLKERKLKPGPIRATVHQYVNHKTINLYDIHEATPKPEPTAAQLRAIEKAREAFKASRTCPRCKEYVFIKLNGQPCSFCKQAVWLEVESSKAKSKFKSWWEDRDSYVILDIETTGLDPFHDEIVEISIVDMNGQTLFESFVHPGCSISEEAMAIHGITEDMLKDAPKWVDIWLEVERIIFNKTLLIYNAAFDISFIRQMCEKMIHPYNLPQTECIMENYARYAESYSDYHRNFSWISLSEAISIENIELHQNHRATNDCYLCFELIRKIGLS